MIIVNCNKKIYFIVEWNYFSNKIKEMLNNLFDTFMVTLTKQINKKKFK